MSRPCGIKLVSLTPGCGYGDAACRYVVGLERVGVPVSWIPTVANRADVLSRKRAAEFLADDIAGRLMDAWQRPLTCDAMLVDIPPFEWQHYWRDREPCLRPYTYVAWEVERVPPDWIPALERYQRVFVPSRFNQQALVRSGVSVPVDVVPHVGREVAAVAGEPAFGAVDSGDFVFYTIGSWLTRKAMDQTIRAYLEAFTAEDPVALVVKTEPVNQVALYAMSPGARRDAPPYVAMVWWTVAKILSEFERPAKVHLVAESLSAREIDHLHTRGDCFVSLARSEGFGLCLFDAALFGNPVVTTGWGGQLDFLGSDHPLLVDFDLEPTARSAPDGCFVHSESVHWARADRRHAAALMREVFDNRDIHQRRAARLKRRLQREYASDRVCKRLAQLMEMRV